MKVLIAEDDPIYRCIHEAMLPKWGYEVVTTCDGLAAWKIMQAPDAPRLALLDWMMPGLDGVDLCRKARAELACPPYLILVTVKTGRKDVVAGLDCGADDYITKPFDPEELRARLAAGRRIVELQRILADRVGQLEDALSQVKHLQGLLPICSYCKKIRDDQDYWQEVDRYVATHSEATFSHGICPDCFLSTVEPQLAAFTRAHKEEKSCQDPFLKGF